uniref:Uncharacterized protein n=1 Tax=Arundo donax TaxID=35708 RepID=A0A0A9FV76_ARUDO
MVHSRDHHVPVGLCNKINLKVMILSLVVEHNTKVC